MGTCSAPCEAWPVSANADLAPAAANSAGTRSDLRAVLHGRKFYLGKDESYIMLFERQCELVDLSKKQLHDRHDAPPRKKASSACAIPATSISLLHLPVSTKGCRKVGGLHTFYQRGSIGRTQSPLALS